MKIQIHREYYCGGTDMVDLPCDWSDIEEWYIKWETFHFKRKGREEFEEIELNLDPCNDVDSKRPVQTRILNEDGTELSDK